MDEIHTCDSSRYWKADTFETRLAAGEEPDKYDKDCIRDYIKRNYSEEEINTKEDLNIPSEVVSKVTNVYKAYWKHLSGNDWCSSSDLNTSVPLDSFVDEYLNDHHNN